MIAEVSVHDGLAVAIGEDRGAEDVVGMKRGRSGKADTDGVKVVEDAAVFRNEVLLVEEADLVVGEIAVEHVATMALVDDDAVVGVHREGCFLVRRIEEPLHHALHGGNVDTGVVVRAGLPDLFHVVDLGEALEVLQLHIAEGVAGLRAQLGAIHEKQDAAETFGANEAVEKRDAGAGFARASGHCDEKVALTEGDTMLDGGDGLALIIAQAGEIDGSAGKFGVGESGLGFEGGEQTGGSVEAGDGVRKVAGEPHIEHPDATASAKLAKVRPAVGGEKKGRVMVAPGRTGVILP